MEQSDANTLHLDLRDSSITEKAIEENPALAALGEGNKKALTQYLQARLKRGQQCRGSRLMRLRRIDRAVSTWQQLNPVDSKRESIEENTGKQFALPVNLPVLAAHLDDMTSYFAEALAPISNPFMTSDGNPEIGALIDRLKRDALARDYYGEIVLALRSLLKYNIGGFSVEWDTGTGKGVGAHGVQQEGNSFRALDMYNTMWDESVHHPREVSTKAEWAATVERTNRIELMRNSIKGVWVGLEDALAQDVTRKGYDAGDSFKLWVDPSSSIPTKDGQDAHTSLGSQTDETVTWSEFGLGEDYGQGDSEHWELTTIYCWIAPNQYGLIGDEAADALTQAGHNPKTFLELWRFELINNQHLVSARPAVSREAFVSGGVATIPHYLGYLTNDQLGAAQRSMLELMKGFQRFSSSMFNIYIEGLRKNVWGVKGVDATMYDVAALKNGETAGLLVSKQPGRDVRTGLARLDDSTGMEPVMGHISNVMQLKDNLFPSQALPSQIAGLDRAVTSQVHTVVQGAQRSLRTLLRLLDSGIMLPSRMQAVRNLKQFEPLTTIEADDEVVAKSLGSGIESMEAERITEALWRLLMAIVQNQEAMQTFNIPGILAYLGKTLNLSVDMAAFVKPPPEAQPPQGGPPPEAAQ